MAELPGVPSGPTPDRLTVLAHERIRAGTFPDIGDAAVQLYDRLMFEAANAAEQVDFAGHLGLDVGGYNGGYRSLIGALGVRRVMTIEPNPPAGGPDRWVGSPMPVRGGLWQGTIQKWVEHSGEPADSVFVFNIMPNASTDPTFLRSLSAATRMRGLLAVTFREATTCQTFLEGIRRNRSLGFRHILNPDLDRSKAPPAPPRGISVRDQYLALFRREPAA